MKLTYQCDYCIRTYEDKIDCLKHEIKCNFNPSNKRCYTCENRIEDMGIDFCKYGNDFEKDDFCPDVLNCSKYKEKKNVEI